MGSFSGHAYKKAKVVANDEIWKGNMAIKNNPYVKQKQTPTPCLKREAFEVPFIFSFVLERIMKLKSLDRVGKNSQFTTSSLLSICLQPCKGNRREVS